MKKILITSIMVALIGISNISFAAANIDTSNVEKGIVSISYSSKAGKKIKVK